MSTEELTSRFPHGAEFLSCAGCAGGLKSAKGFMEQKRTLWIVLASGIFLCVVLGVAVILYSSGSTRNITASDARNQGMVWLSPEEASAKGQNETASTPPPAHTVPASAESQGVADVSTTHDTDDMPQSGNVTVISTGRTSVYSMGGTSTSTIDLSTANGSSAADSNVAALNQAAQNAMTETGRVYRNVESEELPSEASPAASRAQTGSTTAVAQSSEPARAAEPAPAASSAAPATSTATAAAQKESRYWVQAGSFSTTKYADEARAELETNKMPCEVFTFSDSDGSLKYRVRVGPYISKSEAEYWKQRIDSIPLFSKSGSYVVSSTL